MQAQGVAYTDELWAALMPLASWYPAHPLNALFPNNVPSACPEGLAHLKTIVAGLFDCSRDSTLVQATAIWIAFDAGKLKVAPHLALAEFPKIEEYPNTERSKQVAGSIRATLNQMFGEINGWLPGRTGPPPFGFWALRSGLARMDERYGESSIWKP